MGDLIDDGECGSSSDKQLGDHQIRVYDLAGCFLSEPDDSLVDRVGYAVYMTTDAYDCDDEPLAQDSCGGVNIPDERWEIHSLCGPDSYCEE